MGIKAVFTPGARPGQMCSLPITDIFLLKNSATPPRAVALRSCEAPCIRFSHTYRPRRAGYYTLIFKRVSEKRKNIFSFPNERRIYVLIY